MKRILLFVVTNVAVMLVLGIAASVLGLNRFITAQGLNMGTLFGFALIMGFGGAIISLLIRRAEKVTQRDRCTLGRCRASRSSHRGRG